MHVAVSRTSSGPFPLHKLDSVDPGCSCMGWKTPKFNLKNLMVYTDFFNQHGEVNPPGNNFWCTPMPKLTRNLAAHITQPFCHLENHNLLIPDLAWIPEAWQHDIQFYLPKQNQPFANTFKYLNLYSYLWSIIYNMIFRISRFPPDLSVICVEKKKHRWRPGAGCNRQRIPPRRWASIGVEKSSRRRFWGLLTGAGWGVVTWLGKYTKAPMKTKRIKYTWNLEWASDLEILREKHPKVGTGCIVPVKMHCFWSDCVPWSYPDMTGYGNKYLEWMAQYIMYQYQTREIIEQDQY